jgi:5-methylcytosine-specific restriction endonuclease McrA
MMRAPDVVATPRITGRRLQTRRLRWWRRNPLCGASDGGNARAGPDSSCARDGIARVWTQLDHIVALHKGGPDTDANLQGLCDDCHEVKTRKDMGYTGPRPQRIGLDGFPIDDDERSSDADSID